MACVTSCPSGVRYDRLIEQTRERIEQQYDRGPPASWLLRSAVFAVFPHPRRLRAALRFAPSGWAAAAARCRPLAELAPPWRSESGRPSPRRSGERRGRVGLLTGCVQRVLFGDVNAATARVLAAEGFEVSRRATSLLRGAPPPCRAARGGPRARARARRRFARGRRRDRRQRRRLRLAPEGGGPRPCRVVDVSELLAEVEPRAERHRSRSASRSRTRATCATRRASASSRATLLDSIPGLERRRAGRAGDLLRQRRIYNLVQPDAARELGDRKAQHVLATEPDAYASANPGCLVQVSAALRRAGRAYRRSTRSSSSTRRSAASPQASCWLPPGASEIDTARLIEPLELVLAAISELEA